MDVEEEAIPVEIIEEKPEEVVIISHLMTTEKTADVLTPENLS